MRRYAVLAIKGTTRFSSAALALLALLVLWPSEAGAARNPSSDVDDGWEATVSGTGGRGLAILPGPGSSVAGLTTLVEGSRVRVVGASRTDRDGRSWYLVTGYGQTGEVGWTTAESLARVEPDRPTATRAVAAAAPVPIARTLQATLTAYAHGTTTRSGTPVRWGVVAVDPDVIPLGSRLMIEGYDTVFVAEDTGGSVRGAHVDVYFSDVGAALRFGVQRRTVTVLP